MFANRCKDGVMSILGVKSAIEVFGGGGWISDFSAQADLASKLGALDVVTIVTLLEVTSIVVVTSSTDPPVRCFLRDFVVRVVTVELSIDSLVGADSEIILSSRLHSRHFLFAGITGSCVEGRLALRCLRACFAELFCGDGDEGTLDAEDGFSSIWPEVWD